MEAKDFYFELVRETIPYYIITPKEYYDQQGCMSDKSGVADEVVPEGFSELSESTYEYSGNIETGRELLLNAGMVEIKFGLTPGEPSVEPGDDEDEENYEPEEDDYDEIESLLADKEVENPFDYENIGTDVLLRHLRMMLKTENFEEAEKIKLQLHSRGVTQF